MGLHTRCSPRGRALVLRRAWGRSLHGDPFPQREKQMEVNGQKSPPWTVRVSSLYLELASTSFSFAMAAREGCWSSLLLSSSFSSSPLSFSLSLLLLPPFSSKNLDEHLCFCYWFLTGFSLFCCWFLTWLDMLRVGRLLGVVWDCCGVSGAACELVRGWGSLFL